MVDTKHFADCKLSACYFLVCLKIVEKKSGQHGRLKMLKEIETFHCCQGHENILQLIEYFEEEKL